MDVDFFFNFNFNTNLPFYTHSVVSAVVGVTFRSLCRYFSNGRTAFWHVGSMRKDKEPVLQKALQAGFLLLDTSFFLEGLTVNVVTSPTVSIKTLAALQNMSRVQHSVKVV